MTDGILVKEDEALVQREISQMLIPMIQRPYAQGRRSQESVRRKFLTDIFNTLSSNEEKKMELNFIYGSFIALDGDKNVFELLDGQQRMTTLFLLHWYIANQNRATADFVFPKYLNKFVYQTRTTSTDFLTKLISTEVRKDRLPSKAIREAAWYSKSFDKDTTIDSMLRMLDSIHSIYQKCEIKPGYANLSRLQFYVLELNGFGLTEELFIKMNARGLQLTPFENFKADLIGYMKKSNSYTCKMPSSLSKMDRQVEYWINFSSLMDGRWVDLFWEKPQGHDDSGSKESDIRFFRFIQRFFANKAILIAERTRGTQLKEDKYIQFFTNNIEVERHYGFDTYSSFFEKAKGQGKDCIKQLEHLLNFLTHPQIGMVLLNALTAPWEEERAWQPWGTEGRKPHDVGQRQMIILSAMSEFVSKIKDEADFNMKNYNAWMRFVHIMVQGTDITGLDNQITLTKMLQEIIDLTIEGETFEAYKNPLKAIVEYNKTHRENRYLAAEATKAEQVLEEEKWDSVFASAEKDAFTQGSCMFYYEKGMDIENYKLRTSRVGLLFDKDGVTPPLATDYLLIRAVLCRNYDWTSYRKSAYNFNITNSSIDRYLRNITIWNDNQEVKGLFCELLDCDNTENIKEKIYEIIKEKHTVIFKEGYWSGDAYNNLNKSYERLFKEEEMQPLKWLYNLGERAMGCWLYPDGTISLYKGNVNCMFLGFERHKYIRNIMDSFKDKLGLYFDDGRQFDNYQRFGNYSGDNVKITSSADILPHNTRMKLWFIPNGSLTILVSNKTAALNLYNRYLSAYGEDIAIDFNGNSIKDDEGNLSYLYDGGVQYFRVANISDFDKLTGPEHIQVIETLYNEVTFNHETQ